MKNRSLRDKLGKFSYMNFVYFAAMACYFPFYVAYLVKRDFSSTQIGLIVMLNSVVSIVAQPLWGLLCDRLRSVRKVFAFLMLMMGLTVPVIIFLPSYNYIVFWIPMVINLFYCSTNSLSDSWIVQGIKNVPGKSYGTVRLWGSIGFMIAAAIMGRVSDVFATEIVFYVFTALALIDAAIALCIRNEGVADESNAKSSVVRRGFRDIPFGKLFKNHYYLIFVLCAFLLYIPLSVKNNYLVQRVYHAGGSDTLYGFCHSLAALSEVPVFFFSAKLMRRFTPQKTLKFGMVVYFLQFTALAFPIPAWGILIVQCFQGLGYGMFLVSSVAYVDSLSPVGLKTSALTLATAIYGGASGIIGSMLSGFLIDTIGIMRVYFFGSIFAGLAVALYFVLYSLVKRKYPEPLYER